MGEGSEGPSPIRFYCAQQRAWLPQAANDDTQEHADDQGHAAGGHHADGADLHRGAGRGGAGLVCCLGGLGSREGDLDTSREGRVPGHGEQGNRAPGMRGADRGRWRYRRWLMSVTFRAPTVRR